MATLCDRLNAALVIVDVQVGVVACAHNRDAIVGRIAQAVETARRARVPVIWVQHHDDGRLQQGSDNWRIVPELAPASDEPRIEKTYPDSFEATELEALLSRLGVGRLFIAGAQTDACIRSTLHGALVRGYDVTLVEDAHTTEDLSSFGAPTPDKVIAHTNLYWKHQRAPGRAAATTKAAEIDFGAPGAPAAPA